MEPLLGMDFDGAPPHRCASSSNERRKKAWRHEKKRKRRRRRRRPSCRCFFFPNASFLFIVFAFPHAFSSFSCSLSPRVRAGINKDGEATESSSQTKTSRERTKERDDQERDEKKPMLTSMTTTPSPFFLFPPQTTHTHANTGDGAPPPCSRPPFTQQGAPCASLSS